MKFLLLHITYKSVSGTHSSFISIPNKNTIFFIVKQIIKYVIDVQTNHKFMEWKKKNLKKSMCAGSVC